LDKVDAAQLAIDNAIIDDYISANNLGPAQEKNGIKYILKKEGSGVVPCLENTITVGYKGTLLKDGTVFDNRPSGISFPLSRVIVGWQLAFPLFTKGTEAIIFIPSGYGYGTAGNGPVPPNANLIFEISLVNVR
jgi:FKBP-type peptidyl-prolyl cis-trans isomerase